MYAIAKISGKQYKIEKDKSIYTNKLPFEEGSKVEFEDILLIDDKGKVTIGQPTIKGAKVLAKVISHEKGDKIIIFKKKRRKGYRKKNGHRQDFTKILIEKIIVKDAGEIKVADKVITAEEKKVKAGVKVMPKAKEEKVKEVTAKKEVTKKPVVKKPATKKPAAKKPVSKKTT